MFPIVTLFTLKADWPRLMHDWIYYWWVMFHSKTFKMNLKTWWNLSTGYIFNLILSCLRARTISLPWEHSQNSIEDELTDEKSASNYILPVMIECLDCTRNPFFSFWCISYLILFIDLFLQRSNTFQLQGIECFIWKIQKPRSVSHSGYALSHLPWSILFIWFSKVLKPWLHHWCFLAGFEILAFPCNQFLGQEPGSNEEILEAACTMFKAEFPIFDKVIPDEWKRKNNSIITLKKIWSCIEESACDLCWTCFPLLTFLVRLAGAFAYYFSFQLSSLCSNFF